MRFNFRRKKQFNSFEEVLQEVQFKNYTTKSLFENKLISNLSFSGIYILFSVTAFILLAFSAQAFKLQILQNDFYLKKSDINQFVSVPILPMRGNILDRNGVVLASSEKNKVSDNAYENNFIRKYIDKVGFAHVLGYVKYPQKDSSGRYWQNNFEGVSGIEAYYDQLLAGRPGKRVFEKDVGQNLNQSFVTEFPIEGKDIKLSIDSELQEYAHKKLKDFVIEKQFKGGSILIMEIETGQILLMTNYPEYEPQKMLPNTASSTQLSTKDRNNYINEINNDKNTPLLNRAISGTFAPGSTLKTVFALAALQMGLIDPVTSIFSSGRIEVQSSVDPTKKNIFRDWKAHGWVNVRTALAYSSDVFFYAVGGGYENQKGMGINKLAEYAESFGVDSLTGIDLGGESIGNIPTPAWKQKIFKEDWRLGDTYTSSIGQFGFLVTPIGLLRLTSALASNGDLITPKLRIDENVQIKKVKVNVSDEWYKVVQDGMRMVVTVGTAKNLNSDLVEIAGKSGTAEVGVKKDRVQSWIAGYFPFKEPKYAFVFLCELGITDVSPTPNVLARDVIEKMYFMDEYNEKLGGNKTDKTMELSEGMNENVGTEDANEALTR